MLPSMPELFYRRRDRHASKKWDAQASNFFFSIFFFPFQFIKKGTAVISKWSLFSWWRGIDILWRPKKGKGEYDIRYEMKTKITLGRKAERDTAVINKSQKMNKQIVFHYFFLELFPYFPLKFSNFNSPWNIQWRGYLNLSMMKAIFLRPSWESTYRRRERNCAFFELIEGFLTFQLVRA